ncbi:hypothetical protein [Hazenella coriacea]|uniref:Zinc ribbon domain-containing protein n=1 Tax=Hazenella coriacea TaxID=1179467 RepID=A0A4R3L6G5_9BACL|nr:hypothetical protein [Hazenella coriacea]TCS95012.1 hypothetical protein EDD58_103437 [Hazenella coriacea]
MDFFQDLKQKLNRGVETAGKQSQRMLKMSSLTFKIKGKKDDIERLISKLGWEVYRAWEPERILEVSDEIQEALKAVHDLQEECTALEKELEDLKSLDIQATTEKVDVGLTPTNDMDLQVSPVRKEQGDQEQVLPTEAVSPSKEVKQRPVAKNELIPVSPVVYICPFCAHQVANEANNCTHCGKRYY